MEPVSRRSVNKCKEDLEIPFAKEKKKSDKTDKKKTKNEDEKSEIAFKTYNETNF